MRTPLAYFTAKYTEHPDPWGFDTRWYEARKYAVTLAALPRQRYVRAFEPGCANGALTERLAERCDALVASDVVAEVVARAVARLRDSAHVDVRELSVPEGWPEGSFDLVVLSELVYYLDDDGVTALLRRINESLEPGGTVVAVHWTGPTDYPLTGDEAHERLRAHGKRAGWRLLVDHRDEQFVLAAYERGRT